MGKKKTCLTPGCSREVKTRGLCQNCYSSASKMVSNKAIIGGEVVTWDLLVSKGLALPSARVANGHGRFLAALTERIGRQPKQPAQPAQPDSDGPPNDPRVPDMPWQQDKEEEDA